MHPNIKARSLRFTGSGNVSTNPIIVYSVTVAWGDAGANRISLEDIGDPAGSGTERWKAQAAVLAVGVLATQHFEFPAGLFFPNGCYFERNQTDIIASITYKG